MTEAAEPAPDGPPRGGGSVELVGTAHVSADSVEEVERTVEQRQPDVVAVELDEARYRQLQGEAPEDLEASDLLGGNTVFQFLAYWMLSYVQKRLGDRFDIQPGADMKAAVDTAEEHGIGVALVDRDIQTTIQRFWTRLTVPEKLKLVGGLALGATDPLTIGLATGVAVGLFAGALFGVAVAPLVGLGGVLSFGLGDPALALAGGLVVGAFVGLLLVGMFLPPLDLPSYGRVGVVERSVAGAAVGAVAGALVATTGTALPLVGSLDLAGIGAAVVRGGVGVALGAAAGAGVGFLLGTAMDALVEDPGEVEDIDVESMTDTDVVTAMLEEFRRFTPGGAEALIDERDAYIAHELLALREQGFDVVAVVGAGHEAGIRQYLENPGELPPMASLVGTTSGRGIPWFKLVGWAVSLGFVAFFGLLALGVRDDLLMIQLLAAWFVVNGVFAAGLARLAGARWTSAGVGGLVAWMTSVNPLLAPGWFVGYVELRHQPVNVTDIAELNEILDDHESPLGDVVRRMFDVPLFRLVTIVALTNVGSIVASALFGIAVLPWLGAEVGGVGQLPDLMVEGARQGWDLLRGALP